MDKTLILVKPDAFARNLTGEIIARFERKGLRIVALRHMTMDTQLAEQHYAEHDGKPFFGELVSFITSGPLVAMVLEGDEAVRAARQVIGATNPLEATTGSIRGDFAVAVGQNMVHGSDSAGVRRARGERCSSPTSDPRLRLAAAAGDPRAGGHPVRGAGLRRRGGDRGDPPRGRAGERAAQGAARCDGARRADPRRRHATSRSTATSSASRADAERGGHVPRAPLRPHPPGRRRRRRSPAVGRVRRGHRGRLRAPRPLNGRVVREVEGVGGPRRRLRDPGPRRRADHRDPGRLSERRRTAARAAA